MSVCCAVMRLLGVAFRPNTATVVGNAVTNQGNAYDTTAPSVDTSTSSAVSTTNGTTSCNQTYSGMPSLAGQSGTLMVRALVTIDNNGGSLPGSAGSASILYSTDGSTPSLAFDQTSSWSTTNGTFDVLLTKSLTGINPSTIKVKVAEVGAKSGSVPLGTDTLTIVSATVYDIVFIAS